MGLSPLDQVRLLTKGLDLPFPALEERLLRFIATGFTRSWEYLLNEYDNRLLANEEPIITTLMCTRLNALIREDPRWRQLVQKVTRGEETVTYDGGSHEKRPDLSLCLTNGHPNFPLVVECKVIDPQKDVGLYCREGLTRFLEGEYGWATREGFMLAYVRDVSTLDDTLRQYLARHRKKTPDRFATSELPSPIAGLLFHLRRSVHERAFRYPTCTPDEPGTIALWHLWLYGTGASL